MIKTAKQVVLLEWHCWNCNRLLSKYVKGSTGEWHCKCQCKAMNVLRLGDRVA